MNKERWVEVYREGYNKIFCICGCSFFAHDSSLADNPVWHLGPCKKCHKCPRYTTINQWLVPLLKQMEEYSEQEV